MVSQNSYVVVQNCIEESHVWLFSAHPAVRNITYLSYWMVCEMEGKLPYSNYFAILLLPVFVQYST